MISVRAIILLAATPCFAQGAAPGSIPPSAPHPVDFERQIRPLLEAKCVKCHGPEKQRSDLRLDNRAAALRGATDGPVILPGKSAHSRLVASVAGVDEDLVMPPKGERLTAEQVGLIRRWIDDGAAWPEGGSAEDPAKSHWSFQPLRKPPVPGGASPGEGTGAIDAFIRGKLAAQKLAPSSPADPRVLIRRISFALHGLPPAPEEIEAFAVEATLDREGATRKLIDRLLASPRYGERWARHWLDVVRFAESNGFETNQPRPNAWPYRDYVIRSLNDDKPYDQFVREQLAGDALGAGEATGFIVAGAWDSVKSPDPVLTANQRADELHDMASATGSAFLGLTVNCARCHNHKFDPISQADYFAMAAIFAGTRHGERPIADADDSKKQQADALRPRLAEISRALEALEPLADPLAQAPRRPAIDPRRNLERIVPTQATEARFTILETNNGAEPCIDELELLDAKGRNLAREAVPASSGDYAGNPKHMLQHINDGAYGNSRSWISSTPGRGWVSLQWKQPAAIERIVWGRDREEKYRDRAPSKYVIELRHGAGPWITVAGSNDRATKDAPLAAPASPLLQEHADLEKQIAELTAPRVAYAGQFGKPADTFRFHRGDPMQPREKIAPGALSAFGGFQLPLDAPEQQRRLALANWIASPANPLTARVIVNRLWHYHFGTGIVETPSDFGLNGARPSHPELLDWLAAELIEHRWSLQHIHRLILQSATYQQDSRHRPDAAAIDGANRRLWRFPPRRLEAEPLRDTILAVSGKLNLRMGGPGFDLFEPNSNYVKVYATKTKFGPEDFRRMIYQAKPRAELDTLFGAFDCPDAGQIQPKRNTSTTPLQALNLLNSDFLLEQCSAFAERLQRDAGPAARAQAQRAFQLAFGRAAAPEEIAAAEKLITAHGLPAFCRALFNANEFITIY